MARSGLKTRILTWCLLAGAACNEHTPRPAPPDKPPVRVVVAEEAARAADAIGVDLAALVERTVRTIDADLDVPVTTVTVHVNPRRVIPETGVGGFTRPGGDVRVFLDPARPDFAEALDVWLPPMLAHELHHAARVVDGPGYGESLVEAIVSEGLADVYAAEVFPETPASPWTRALPRGGMCRAWSEALRRRGPYDDGAWFFGEGRRRRWTGYTIGYALVRRFLEAHPDETAAGLVATRAEPIVAGARLCGLPSRAGPSGFFRNF